MMVSFTDEVSKIWWMRYRDASGSRRLESTGTEVWDEAQRRLRERLQARDNRTLEVVRRGEQLFFRDWRRFLWRTIPSPQFVQRKPMRPMSGR